MSRTVRVESRKLRWAARYKYTCIGTHVIQNSRYMWPVAYIYGSKGKRDTMLVGEILRSNDQYFARCISIERRKPPEDKPVHYRVLESKLLHKGAVWDVVQEKLDYRGETISREFVSHPGAVGVLALNDKNEALLIRQYRHPIRTREWEIPAGMLDLSGESPLMLPSVSYQKKWICVHKPGTP